MSGIRFLSSITCAAAAAFILSGCASSGAPDGYLPGDEESQWDVYGSWLTLKIRNMTGDSTLAGEFISVKDSSICILTESRLEFVPYYMIEHVQLESHRNKSDLIGAWAALGTLSTISHGVILVISAPVWLLSGIPMASAESYSGKIIVDTPDLNWWTTNTKFSRFPQGIPNSVDIRKLKLKKYRL